MTDMIQKNVSGFIIIILLIYSILIIDFNLYSHTCVRQI